MSEDAVEYRADGGAGAKKEAQELMRDAFRMEQNARSFEAQAAHCHAEAVRFLADALEKMGILKKVEKLKG
jgi:hypothetical protein